jgi:HEAT repeat protein/cyclophilin family peptidyl-prolyl cis-trans isomerase
MFSMKRIVSACALAAVAAGCASAPPAPAVAPVTFNQKMAWILRLEDHRILRDAVQAPAPAPPKGKRAAVAPPPPAPDLIRLLSDPEARVRRRAALAVGRVGLADGVDPLIGLLADPEPEVRQMAAFALGLIGDRRAEDALVKALADSSPLMQGSAAEALGLIGDAHAAPAIATMIAAIVGSGAVAQPPPPEDEARRDTPAAAFRLGVFALARLKAYEPLAGVVLDGSGRPKVTWWPVAFALQRLNDPRAIPALTTLAKEGGPYARAFAVKGLAEMKAASALPVFRMLLTSGDHGVLVQTIRALGRVGEDADADAVLKIARDPKADPQLRLEAVAALGHFHTQPAIDTLLDSLGDPSPAIRSAALRATASADADNFMTVLSGLDPDPHWSVRATLAEVLAGLPEDRGLPRLTAMLGDTDQRVVPSILAALVRLHAPKIESILFDRLKADDPVVRAAAARAIGELKPAGGAEALAAAYRAGERDATYVARAAALAALVRYGAADAVPVLRSALADKDWAVRVRAAELLHPLDASIDAAAAIRPAPSVFTTATYESPAVVEPPVSTEVYIDTDKGTIEVELAMLDAPLTVQNFIALARKGFFNGLSVHRVVPDFVVQDGDPRGDGEGGPGYTIRDELNERPYLRGAVGMALDWRDTGGSQWFITASPQPHLDAKYTVFGRVVSGMDVVDRLQPWDTIQRVRVWDGKQMTAR